MTRKSKPIRVFFSPFSRRFYASRAWKELKPGVVLVTGEQFDVTEDITSIVTRHNVNFGNSINTEDLK